MERGKTSFLSNATALVLDYSPHYNKHTPEKQKNDVLYGPTV